MTRLNQLQQDLLTNADRRRSGSLLPFPDGIADDAARLDRAIAALLRRGLIGEAVITGRKAAWRVDGTQRIGLMITGAGRDAVGLALPCPDEPTTEAPTRTTKTGMVIALLEQDDGASLDELVELTGWLPHTARAALTGLRKKGFEIARSNVDGCSRYQIASAA